MVEYDVLGNERHKAICKLRKMPKLYPNKDGGADLYAWKSALADAIGADTELFSAIRNRLIHLLGGDQPTLSDMLREDDDGVDAGGRDEDGSGDTSAPSPQCDCGSRCGGLAEEVAPITTELRSNMRIYGKFSIDDGKKHVELDVETFGQLCDAIDAIHAGLERDYATACRVNEHQDLEYVALAKRYDNTISLPLDADGVPIHAGDVLDGYGKTIEAVELRIGRSGWVIISRDGNGYADTFAFTHHHAPTVEDVLREMLDAWGELPSNAANEAIIAEYADKLKLADA